MLIFQLLFGCIFSIQKHQWSSCLCHSSLAYSSYPKDEDNWDPDITFCHQFNHQNLQKLIEHVYLKVSISSNFLRILETLQSIVLQSFGIYFFSPTHTLQESVANLHSDGEEKLNIFSVQIFLQFAFIKLRVFLIHVTKHYGKNCGSSL